MSAGRDNNLNLIRMTAALAVLVSHAWPMTMGPDAVQPLERLVGVQLGTLAVLVFFAVSGFLVTRSYERQPTPARYLSARALRILPGLAVVLLLSALVLGPMMTSLPLAAYFSDVRFLTYVPAGLSLFRDQPELPGVFATLPRGPAVNVSLWTLKYEVTCYLAVLAMGMLGAFRSRNVLLVVVLAYVIATLAVRLLRPEIYFISTLSFLAMPFACGVAFHIVQRHVPLTPWILAGLVLAAWAARHTPLYDPLLVLTLTYGTFVLAYLPAGAVRSYNRLGDYSYGVYIYAWPVQQTAVELMGPMSPMQNILVSVPVVLGLAWLSWTLVERPALALVGRPTNRKDRSTQALF